MSASSCCPYIGLSGLICPRHTHYSEILYVVILTIISAIYTLCGVPVLIWLHLSSIVINGVSHSSYGVSL